jgi:RNA polymerase subunit RPABC4/transcription elongation factor Spt4
MLPVGVFGIESEALDTAVKLLVLVLVVVWLALVYYTYADGSRRIADRMIVGCAVVAALLFPYVGTLVYMIMRPPEYLDDVRERELEMQAAEARLVSLDYQLCPHCEYEVKSDYLRCPNCQRKLKDRCYSCGKAVDPDWTLCPYCEAEMGAPPAPSGSRRRRRQATAEEPAAAEAPTSRSKR